MESSENIHMQDHHIEVCQTTSSQKATSQHMKSHRHTSSVSIDLKEGIKGKQLTTCIIIDLASHLPYYVKLDQNLEQTSGISLIAVQDEVRTPRAKNPSISHYYHTIN